MKKYNIQRISENKPCPFRRGDKVRLAHTDGLDRHHHYLGQTLTVDIIFESCVRLVEYPDDGANFWARYELVKARETPNFDVKEVEL